MVDSYGNWYEGGYSDEGLAGNGTYRIQSQSVTVSGTFLESYRIENATLLFDKGDCFKGSGTLTPEGKWSYFEGDGEYAHKGGDLFKGSIKIKIHSIGHSYEGEGEIIRKDGSIERGCFRD